MKWSEGSWPPELNPKEMPQYPAWMVRLANSRRRRSRFWLSPVGMIIVLALLGGAAVVQLLTFGELFPR